MDKVLGERAGVTAKQRACYDARREGKTWEEIGQLMTMSPQTARDHVKAAERNGLEPLATQRRGAGGLAGGLRAEVAVPWVADRVAKWAAQDEARVVAQRGSAFDLKAFLEMAAAAGVPGRAAQALGRRIQGNLGVVSQEMRSMTLAERVTDITAKADWVASHIDPVSIAGMNAKDIALTWKLLIDGAQLLGGKPTAIVDFNVRRRLEVLMPEMLAEARRRGIVLEGQSTRLPETPDNA